MTLRFYLRLLIVLTLPTWAAPQWTPERWCSHGLHVAFLAHPGSQLIDIRLLVHQGAASSPPGLAAITNDLIFYGKPSFDHTAIAKAFESIGADMGGHVTQDSAWVDLRTRQTPQTWPLAKQAWLKMLHHPSFADAAIQSVKQSMMTAIRQQHQTPGGLASLHVWQTLYPNHPYRFKTTGTLTTLKAINRQAIRHLYQTQYTPENSTLIVVGDLSHKAVESLAKATAQALAQNAVAHQALPSVPSLPHRASSVIERPSPNRQSMLILAQHGANAQLRSREALKLGTSILGGHMYSRLQQQVRNQHGLSYGIHSFCYLMARKGPCMIQLQTQNNQRKKALQITRDVTKKFLKEGPTPEELREAKQRLTTQYLRQMATQQGQLNAITSLVRYQRPNHDLQTFLSRLNAIDIQTVSSIMRRYFKDASWQVFDIHPMKHAS